MMYNGESRKTLDIPVRPQRRKRINFVNKKDRTPNQDPKNEGI